MQAKFDRFIGQTVEMIYLDNRLRLSQRKVRVLSADKESLMAYCYKRRAPRLFRVDNVLAIMPTQSHAV